MYVKTYCLLRLISFSSIREQDLILLRYLEILGNCFASHDNCFASHEQYFNYVILFNMRVKHL